MKREMIGGYTIKSEGGVGRGFAKVTRVREGIRLKAILLGLVGGDHCGSSL